jgi:predicted MFS family arabinose efflux permease
MVFAVNLGRVVFASLLEPLRTAFGVETAALGLLATLVWVGSALPRLPTGWLLTKVPRHVVIFGAGSLLTVVTVVAANAPGIRALQVAAFLMGVAGGVYFIAANPLVSELFPDRVGRAIGIHGMASQSAAAGSGVFVTAVLVLADWTAAFWSIAAVAAVSTVAFTAMAWRTDLPEAGSGDRKLWTAIRAQWRIILAGTIMFGVAGFVWQGVFNFYVTYLMGKGVTEDSARLLLSLAFTAGVPAFLISGRLADELPIVTYILSLLAGFIALLFVLTLVSGFAALAVVSVAIGYVMHSLFPAGDTYLLGSLPDRHRASAYSAFSAAMMTIQASGSWVVGELESSFTFTTIFQTFGLGLLVLLAVLALAHSRDRLPTAARV